MTDLLLSLPKLEVTPQLYKSLPESAGIYVYFSDSEVIYIGKAINLKRRVSSYFDLDLEVKTAKMMSEAEKLSFIQVTSELEALLLEARLIRTYLPKYNIISKDDKHPLYIVITKERYPRVLAVRKLISNSLPRVSSYGPFPSSGNVRSVLRMIRRVFPYSDHKIGKRPCLYSHIGLCDPCPNEILKIENLKLKSQSEQKYKNNVRNIKNILDGKMSNVQKELEKNMTKFSELQQYEEAKTLRDQIKKLEYITRPQMPTDFYLENPNLYEDTRNKESIEFKKVLTRSHLIVESLKRIECYDISHLAGTNATASMVTFIDGEADKSFYRHFKIRQVKGNSDIDSMKEVVTRRIKHLSDWGRPDLIIVDGGMAQVSTFVSVLRYNGTDTPVVGIAKHPDRLIVGNQKIKLEGSVLNLVSRIRDEAHRFAQVYHHKLVSRSLLSSKSEKFIPR